MGTPTGGDHNIGNSRDRVDESKRTEASDGAHANMLKTVFDATVGHQPGQEAAAVAAIGNLNQKDIAALTPKEIGQFSTAMINALKPEQIAMMNPTQIGGFSEGARGAMTQAQNESALGVMAKSIMEKTAYLSGSGNPFTPDADHRAVLEYVQAAGNNPKGTLENLRKAVSS